MKPTGAEIAAEAIQTKGKYSYSEMDCRDFVNHCINACGGNANYAGSNTMARKADYIGTIEVAKAQGYLVPGVCVMINKDDKQEPTQYQGDGLGNFDHVGIYVGENAVKDTDKHGTERMCNVMHSGKTIGRVAGSTLKNGWTHVAWLPDIDYGQDVPVGPVLPPDMGIGQATVHTGGGDLNFRQEPSSDSGRVKGCKTIPDGATVGVVAYQDAEWTEITYKGHQGYVMDKFLVHSDKPVPVPPISFGVTITDEKGNVFHPVGSFKVEYK